ncbi:hypothetical protein [Streptomyces phaeochromogenes]
MRGKEEVSGEPHYEADVRVVMRFPASDKLAALVRDGSVSADDVYGLSEGVIRTSSAYPDDVSDEIDMSSALPDLTYDSDSGLVAEIAGSIGLDSIEPGFVAQTVAQPGRRLFGSWTTVIEVPRPWVISSVRGPLPDQQSPHRVRLTLSLGTPNRSTTVRIYEDPADVPEVASDDSSEENDSLARSLPPMAAVTTIILLVVGRQTLLLMAAVTRSPATSRAPAPAGAVSTWRTPAGLLVVAGTALLLAYVHQYRWAHLGFYFTSPRHPWLETTRSLYGILGAVAYSFLWIIAPLVLHALLTHRYRHAPPTLRQTAFVAAPPLAACLLSLYLLSPWLPAHGLTHVGWWCLAPAPIALLTARRIWPAAHRWRAPLIWAAVLMLPTATQLICVPLNIGFTTHAFDFIPSWEFVLISLGLVWPWVAVFALICRRYVPALQPRGRTVALALLVAVVASYRVDNPPTNGEPFDYRNTFSPVAMFGYVEGSYSADEAVLDSAANLAVVTVLVLCLAGMRYYGRSRDTAWSPAQRVMCVAVLAIALMSGLWMLNVVYILQYPHVPLKWLTALVGAMWLIPLSSCHEDKATGKATDESRAAAVDRLIKAQTVASARRSYLRDSGPQLATTEVTQRAWHTRWHQLGGHADPTGGPLARERGLRAAALGHGGPWAPWKRASVGALITLLASAPWAWNQLTSFGAGWLSTSTSTIQMVQILMLAVHWALYGAVFGYSLPHLRGDTPVAKAVRFLPVITVSEVIIVGFEGDIWLVGTSFGVATSVVACLALGLAFEAALVRSAGYRWTDVRSFRSLGGLLTPVTTFVVAVATAVATVLATAWSTSLVPAGPLEQAPALIQPSDSPDLHGPNP